MQIMHIESVSNPRVKQWTQLLQKKGRDRQEKFIVEGVHLVQEALRSGFPIDCIVYNQSLGLPDELKIPEDILCIAVSETIIKKCTETQTPQAVFAVMPKWRWPTKDTEQEHGLFVVVDRIQDPGNLGTIIRSADAVGADGVFIEKGSADMYHPKTVRSTMGSLFHLPIIETELVQLLSRVQSSGGRIVGSLLTADKHCYEMDWTGNIWLIIGNEGSGISENLLPFITDQIKIPMHGKSESLNAAMAASILLYEALRQRCYR